MGDSMTMTCRHCHRRIALVNLLDASPYVHVATGERWGPGPPIGAPADRWHDAQPTATTTPAVNGPTDGDTLFAPPRARPTDPATSHQAAATVAATTGRQVVLETLRAHPAGLCDEELVAVVGDRLSPSGARTRRRELVDAGLVADSGIRRRTRAGRKTIVWRVME